MEFISKNADLINILSADLSLISATVLKINLYLNEIDELFVEVRAKLMYDKEKRIIELKFMRIKEYSFYASHPSLFKYIEDYKFFYNENGVYFSLDPFWENMEKVISTQDQNFILADEVEGYFIST